MCAACVHLRATGGIVLARTIRCTAFDSELSDAPSALAVVRANALILAEQGKCPAFDPLAKPNQPDSYVSLDLLDSRRAADLAGCPCTTCITRYQTEHQGHSLINHMVLCPKCGNKRCPHANNHTNACTGSNEPGQPGSNY